MRVALAVAGLPTATGAASLKASVAAENAAAEKQALRSRRLSPPPHRGVSNLPQPPSFRAVRRTSPRSRPWPRSPSAAVPCGVRSRPVSAPTCRLAVSQHTEPRLFGCRRMQDVVRETGGNAAAVWLLGGGKGIQRGRQIHRGGGTNWGLLEGGRVQQQRPQCLDLSVRLGPKCCGRDPKQVRELRWQSVIGEVGPPSGELLPCDPQGQSVGNKSAFNSSIERREPL